MKKIMALIIGCICSIYLTLLVKNKTELSIFQQTFVGIYFFISSIIITVFIQMRGFLRKKERKRLFFLVIISMLFFLLWKNVLVPTDYEDNVVEIIATGERNESSNAYEIWISDIEINGKRKDIDTIALEQGWSIEKGNILANAGKERVSFFLHIEEMESVKISFGKHDWSGIVEIKCGNFEQQIDLYSADGGSVQVEIAGTYRGKGVAEKAIFYIGGLLCVFLCVVLVGMSLPKKMSAGFIIPVIHWLVSFRTDSLIFTYSAGANWRTVIYKLLFLLFLMVMWNMIFLVWRSRKSIRDNKKACHFIQYFTVYFGINLMILILIWPGNWIWDEYGILNAARNLGVDVWQHYLTTVFYVFSLMLFPFPAGILIVQNIVIAMLVAAIMIMIEEKAAYKKLVWICMLLFLLPPALRQNHYPIRLSIYGYLECCFAVYLLFHNKSVLCSKTKIIGFSLLIAILSVWRSEGIIILILTLCFYWYEGFQKRQDLRNIKLFTICALLGTLMLKLPQDILLDKAGRDNSYEVTAYIESLDDLIKEEYRREPSSSILSELEKILDIDKVIAANSGEAAFWNGAVNGDVNNVMLKELRMAYVQLFLKYPKEFVIERVDTFLQTAGGKKIPNAIATNSANLFYDTREAVRYFREELPFNRPFSIKLREDILNMINCIELDSRSDSAFTPLYYFFYNIIGGMVCIAVVCIGLRKKKETRLVAAVCSLQILAVMITAPGKYFMYYFPIYLFGNVCVWICINGVISCVKSEKIRK